MRLFLILCCLALIALMLQRHHLASSYHAKASRLLACVDSQALYRTAADAVDYCASRAHP